MTPHDIMNHIIAILILYIVIGIGIIIMAENKVSLFDGAVTFSADEETKCKR